ncbi:sulfotransferase family protein [Bacteroidota bacterium]|nr:sulfotransferase family protein [Bacteroidota bacterium]
MKSGKTISPKIICVGYQKTGTTTIRQALTILGYKIAGNNHNLLLPILHKRFDIILDFIDKVDAVADNPWPKIYKELDIEIPGCKFILTLRDEESWYKSVSSHIGELRNPMHEWLYGKGKGVPKYNKESVIETYRNHLAEVHEYFKNRPEDLLIMDLKKGDGWEKLCAFLNKEIPEIPFPHANKAEARVKRTLYFKAKQKLKFFLQINYINMRELIK